MFRLALRTLRFRTAGFTATFVAMFLGALILMSFASLVDTSQAADVDRASREILIIMASVVGGWGLLIVTFAVSSTLGLLVYQRNSEMALLKSVGATPAQIGRMIIGESAVVALAAAGAATPLAMLGGETIVAVLIDTGQLPAGVTFHFGTIAVGVGVGVTLLAATAAAALTTRRATRVRVTDAMRVASTGERKLGWKRVALGGLLLAGGINCGVLTATVLRDGGEEVMAIAGQAFILSAIGFAVLAPVLARASIAVFGGAVRVLGGVSGYLTVLNVRQRAHQIGGALTPIILFTGIATGTLYMQSIENAAVAASGMPTSADHRTIETLNLVIVGIIALFAAIMVVNTLIAVTVHRRRELGQQRLIGSTRPQVLGMVGVEGVVLTATGVLFGSIAAVISIVPYSIARTGSAVPDTTIGIYLGVVATAVILTLVSSVGTAGRVTRTRAIDAVAA